MPWQRVETWEFWPCLCSANLNTLPPGEWLESWSFMAGRMSTTRSFGVWLANRVWLSGGGCCGRHRQGDADLGPVLEPTHSCRATVARHAAEDRLADPQAILGDIRQVEARAMVAHERLHELRAHLDIDRDRRCAMSDSIEQRLAQRPHKHCSAGVQGAVAGHDQLDGYAVEVLHLVRDLRDRGGQAGLGADRAGIQPTTELTFLGPREADHF